MRKVALMLCVVSTCFVTPAFAQSRRGATRVDFDDALIKGQTNRGAVHLLERRDAELGSLIKRRVHYREELLREVGKTAATSGLQRVERK